MYIHETNIKERLKKISLHIYILHIHTRGGMYSSVVNLCYLIDVNFKEATEETNAERTSATKMCSSVKHFNTTKEVTNFT